MELPEDLMRQTSIKTQSSESLGQEEAGHTR